MVVLCLAAGAAEAEDSATVLWYRQPARAWTEALPIGNGRLGAMVFGGAADERLQLNEDTVWTGGPYDPARPERPEALAEIRRLVFAGRYREANDLFGRSLMGRPVEQMKYQPLGDLRLHFPGHAEATDYRRELDLDAAVVRVAYRLAGVGFTREAFASAADPAIVLRLRADRPGSLSFTARLAGVRNTTHSSYGDDFFRMDGAPPDGLVLRGRTATYLAVPGRVRYEARLRATAGGGQVSVEGAELRITGADEATLVVVAATNVVDYRDVGGDEGARVQESLRHIGNRSYEALQRDHLAAHHQLFRRASVSLPAGDTSALPTDERQARFAEGRDPALAALLFHFGRYVLLGSSRPGSEPANLQGIWNEDTNPWWDSKYTTNINLEMNYWPAEVANLPETTEPLFRLMREIAEGPGARAAQAHYGARGWVLHQNTDLWRAASPMDGPTWGAWPTGGAWLATHLWEHYLYAGDRRFLEQSWPILEGAARFFLDTLVEHPQRGWLLTCPSSSPENFPARPGNERYYDEVSGIDLPGTTIAAGPAMDSAILRDLFTAVIRASEILGRDADLRKHVIEVRARLPPPLVAPDGRLQEWLEDWDGIEKDHRHVSHLYALFPSAQITPRGTPALAEAARQSLLRRGDRSSGWAMAWRLNLWARLLDGEHAYRLLTAIAGDATFPNLFSRGGKALQVDGTLGTTSGIAEMLLQSHAGEIELLPALPAAWPSGSFRGLRARGGFEVDLDWRNGVAERAVLRSSLGGKARLRARGLGHVRCDDRPVAAARPEKDVLSFAAGAGQTCVVTAP